MFAILRAQPRFLLLLVLAALVISGNGIVAPVLSLYASTFSVGATAVGMVITVFGVARLFANLPAGMLSQRWGVKPLMAAGALILIVGSIGAACSHSLAALLFWRFVQGLGSGVYMTCSQAALADSVSAGERGKMMALYQGATLLGAGLGPVIGGYLASAFGLAAPFWGYATVSAVALAAIFALPAAAPQPPPVAGQALPDTRLRALLANRTLLLVCCVTFGVFFTRTVALWELIPLIGHHRFGMGTHEIGMALTLCSVMTFLMLPAAGRIIDRFPGAGVVVASSTLAGVALLAIGLAPAPWVYWLGMIGLGLGNGLGGPAALSYAVDLVPRNALGAAMGLQRTFGDMGFVLGPIVVGLLGDFGGVGYAGGMMVNAAIVIAAAVALYLWGGRRDRSREPG